MDNRNSAKQVLADATSSSPPRDIAQPRSLFVKWWEAGGRNEREAGVHFSRFAFSPTVIMAWRGVCAALTMTMTIANGIGASPRSTVVCVVATPSCLRYMLIVVLEVKNPTNHLLVPSSLRIESKNPQTHPRSINANNNGLWARQPTGIGRGGWIY